MHEFSEDISTDYAATTAMATPPPAAWELGWDMRAFHGSLRKSRRAKGLTQRQLAEVMGVRVYVIGGVELLTVRPTNALRDQLADFLGLDPQQVWPDWLEPRDGSMRATAYQSMTEEVFSALDSKGASQVRQLEDRSDGPDREAVRRELLEKNMERALATLSPRYREIIKMRYGLDGIRQHGLAEIALMWQITRERVRQIEMRALQKLRNAGSLLNPVAEDMGFLHLCDRCHEPYTVARFCNACKVQGCGGCMARRTVADKYVYLCSVCNRDKG